MPVTVSLILAAGINPEVRFNCRIPALGNAVWCVSMANGLFCPLNIILLVNDEGILELNTPLTVLKKFSKIHSASFVCENAVSYLPIDEYALPKEGILDANTRIRKSLIKLLDETFISLNLIIIFSYGTLSNGINNQFAAETLTSDNLYSAIFVTIYPSSLLWYGEAHTVCPFEDFCKY